MVVIKIVVAVIVGVSEMDTKRAIAFAKDAEKIGADGLIYQDLDSLKAAVHSLNPSITVFETSCFDGCYVTGDITPQFLKGLAVARDESRGEVVGADQ